MLRWALTGADASKVTTTGNAAHDLKVLYETGKETILGKADRINNIYDLEGNGWEWTAEGSIQSYVGSSGFSYDRSFRGGNSISGVVPNGILPPSNRDISYYGPTSTNQRLCSRVIIYIK